MGGTFIDIGANVGLYTCIMASHVGPAGSVIAFEPMPECIEQLRHNIGLNEFQNVAIQPLAISNRVGTIELFVPAVHAGGPSGATQIWDPGGWKVCGGASSTTLDVAFRGDSLDFINSSLAHF